MILINLTGDYKIDEPGGTTDELHHLDALLSALSGSTLKADSKAHFLIADLVSRVKRTGPQGLALQITSSLTENELTHDFRIVEI